MATCLFCKTTTNKKSYLPSTTFNNRVFDYLVCENCKLIFTWPPLRNEDYELLYASAYHEQFYFKDKGTDFNRKYEKINRYTSGKNMLDFGCGDGQLLDYFSKRDYSCYGAEYDPKLVTRLARQYPYIHFQTIDDLAKTTGNTYDIIHLGDVFEHLTTPIETINRLAAHLNPNGIMMLEGPLENNFNIAYLFRKIYFTLKKIHNPSFVADHLPYHTLFTNSKNQLAYFRNNGFSTQLYEIEEWVWPFEAKWENTQGLMSKVKYLIAKFSILISKFVKSWGNRFIYIGTKK